MCSEAHSACARLFSVGHLRESRNSFLAFVTLPDSSSRLAKALDNSVSESGGGVGGPISSFFDRAEKRTIPADDATPTSADMSQGSRPVAVDLTSKRCASNASPWCTKRRAAERRTNLLSGLMAQAT